MTGVCYTWSNKQEIPTLEKLDRVLMSPEWEDLYTLASVHKLVKDISDHNPLLVDGGSASSRTPGSRCFKFDNAWLSNPELFPLVSEIWSRPVYTSNPIDSLNIKLKRIKKFFKGWGSNLFGHNKIRRKIIKLELQELEKLEETDGLCGDAYTRKLDILVELNKMYVEEELHWHQFSNERWLLKGDNNTGFFHKVANGRRRKNSMISLECGSTIIEGTKNLLVHATESYKSLFGPAPGNLCQIDAALWSQDEMITPSDNEELTRPFSLEEIKKALFSMNSNRAPGPDDIPVEFYQHCWEVVAQDLLCLFDWFHDGKLDVQRLNYGIITLLPKSTDASRIQQYRPICLLRCPYKLLTKAMDIRASKYAHKLFSIHQNAFIKGRHIVDGILSLHEILHYTHFRRQVGVVLKLDFEKAYDKVNWDFLLDCHRKRGFNSKWCGWVSQILKNGTVSVKINDEVGPYIQSAKGVRQGDPHSPFLFNIAADCLTKMVLTAQKMASLKV